MTDNDIIKAFECCITYTSNECPNCPNNELRFKGIHCKQKTYKDALDLINRQKAEIERWQEECGKQSVLWSKHYESIFESAKEVVRAEAITEFAERLKKEKWSARTCLGMRYFVEVIVIDQIAKEMKGEQ